MSTRAGPSRSQRAQRNASQSQPKRKSSRREPQPADDEEEEEEIVGGDDDDEPLDADVQSRVSALVRLALFNEQRHLPLKREEISKKVLGTQRGGFKEVFDGAQAVLRDTFGLELVELQTRAATADVALEGTKRKRGEDGEPGPSQPAPTQSQGGRKRGGAPATGAKAYILRSVLPAALVELAAQTDAAVLEAEMADAPDAPDDEDGVGARSYGAVLAWSAGDALGALGITHVVLALILVSGRVISDGDLRALLKRLRLREGDLVEFPATAPHRTATVDAFLGDLVRRQYLDRARPGAGGKRGRGGPAPADDGEGAGVEWRWGPRAFAEIGEVGVAQFVAEFMAERRGEVESSDDEEGDERARRARRAAREGEDGKRLAATMRGIERAVGGELADVVSA